MIRRLIPAALLLCCANAALAAEPAVPRGQLSDAVQPASYDLFLTVDPAQERFSGVTTITVDIKTPQPFIWLHGLGLSVSEATITQGGKTIKARYTEAEPVTGVARLDLASMPAAGAATIRIAYTAPYREGAEGLYRTEVAGKWYGFTQMEPIDGRRMFPSFDEPRFKTPFTVSVSTPTGNKVVANAPLAKTTPQNHGMTLFSFAPTKPLPTYLVALAVGPLDIVEGAIPPSAVRKTAVPFRGVATEGQGSRLAYALQHTPKHVALLEDYFGIPYPYEKLDIIASPQMGGAMENAGAIIYNDNLILLNPNAPIQQQRSFGIVSAHELAHHWFGDLVTPAWWTDIWLNESFAEWMGVKASHLWRPDLGISTGLTADALGAMSIDSRKAGRPIYQPVTDNTQIASTFDGITYEKGAGVLAMIESYMGPEKFQAGVRKHLRAHAHGNATASQFFAAMADAAGDPQVLSAFKSFIEQEGVPLVTVARSADGKQLTLRQARYRPVGSAIQPGQTWVIPFCAKFYAGAQSTKTCTIMTGTEATLAVPAGFEQAAVMPNADGAGYYRFALAADDQAKLLALGVQLPDREALALADSLQAAFDANVTTFDALGAAAQALVGHKERRAALWLPGSLAELDRQTLSGAASAALKARIGGMLKPELAKLGFDPRAGAHRSEPADRQALRQTLVAGLFFDAEDDGITKTLADAAQASLANADALDVGFRATAWSAGVKALGKPFASQLAARLLEGKDSYERAHAAFALGHTQDLALAAEMRALALDKRLRFQESLSIIGSQFEGPATRSAAWAWFKENASVMFDRLPGFSQPRLIEIAQGFCTPEQRADVASFFPAWIAKLGGGKLELERTLESIDLCLARKAAHGAELASLN